LQKTGFPSTGLNGTSQSDEQSAHLALCISLGAEENLRSELKLLLNPALNDLDVLLSFLFLVFLPIKSPHSFFTKKAARRTVNIDK
jgi:hypothetical protein